METVLDGIADAIGALIVTLSENKSGAVKYAVNVEGVRGIKNAVDALVTEVQATGKTQTMKEHPDTLAMLNAASEELKKQAAELLTASIEAKKNSNDVPTIDRCLLAAKAILKAVVNLVLIEDRANLDTLSWFVKEVALCVREVNLVHNDNEFKEVANHSTKQLTLFTDFAVTRLQGHRYPELKDRLKAKVEFVSKDGPKAHWPAVAACLNNPGNAELIKKREQASEAIVDALEEITEILRKMYELNESFIDQEFRRPPPLTFKKENFMETLDNVQRKFNEMKNTDDPFSREKIAKEVDDQLREINLRALSPKDRERVKPIVDEVQDAVKNYLEGLKKVPHDERGSQKKGHRTAEDDEGLRAIQNALSNLRHTMLPLDEALAHERNLINDLIDDAVTLGHPLAGKDLKKQGERHRNLLDQALQNPLNRNYNNLRKARDDLDAGLKALDKDGLNPSTIAKIRDAVNDSVSLRDEILARDADVKRALKYVRKAPPTNKAAADAEVNNVLDAIKRHIAAARKARGLLQGNEIANYDEAEAEYLRILRNLRPIGFPTVSQDEMIKESPVVYVSSSRVTAAALPVRAERAEIAEAHLLPPKFNDHLSKLDKTSKQVAEAAANAALANDKSLPFTQLEQAGKVRTVMDAIRDHIAAARAARNTLEENASNPNTAAKISYLGRAIDNLAKRLTFLEKDPNALNDALARQISAEAADVANAARSAFYTYPDKSLRDLGIVLLSITESAEDVTVAAGAASDTLSRNKPLLSISLSSDPTVSSSATVGASAKPSGASSVLSPRTKERNAVVAADNRVALTRTRNALEKLKNAIEASSFAWQNSERKAEVEKTLKELDEILGRIDDSLRLLDEKPDDEATLAKAIEDSKKALELAARAKKVLTEALKKDAQTLPPELVNKLKLVHNMSPVQVAASLADEIAKAIEELYRTEIDTDGNATTWLTLNRDNMDRYNRFLRAVEASKSNFIKEERQNEIQQAIANLRPVLGTLAKQAEELQEGGDRKELGPKIKETLTLAKHETATVAAVVQPRADDAVLTPTPAPAVAKPPAPSPVPADPSLPALNPAADPKFLQVATKMRTDIKRIEDKISPSTTLLKNPVQAAQNIAAKIADVGAAIREKNPRKIVDGAKATQKSVQDLLAASKEFLAQCKDERLKQQYLSEIQAIEALTTQLKIIAAVCASQTDDVDSQEKLLSLTEKISQATQRALRAAELCVLAPKK